MSMEQSVTPEVSKADPGLGPGVRMFSNSGKISIRYQVLNAHVNSQNQPELVIQTRLFHDGKQIYDSNTIPFEAMKQFDPKLLNMDNQLALDPNWEAGEYILQVLVTDKVATPGPAVASESIDFEIRPRPSGKI